MFYKKILSLVILIMLITATIPVLGFYELDSNIIKIYSHDEIDSNIVKVYELDALDSSVIEELSSDKLDNNVIQEKFVSDQILVKFKDISYFPGEEKQYWDEVEKLTKFCTADYIEEIDTYIIETENLLKNPNAVLNRFKNSKFIEIAELNSIEEPSRVPEDPKYDELGSVCASWINAEKGWDIATNSNIPVAVLDTGMYSHPDLPEPKIVYNAVRDNDDITDIHGHGTKVVGTLCGIANNGIGNTGVIWDYSELIFVRISEANDGAANVGNMAKGIIYAVDNGAKIINISYGGSTSVTKKNAIDYAYNNGCVVIAATGNSSTPTNLAEVAYPAKYDNVLGVGALSSSTKRASYSSGGIGLDIMASGMWYSTSNSGGYVLWSGTSCAAPVASGATALVWEILPDYTNKQIMEFMKDNARDLGPEGWDPDTGYGAVDLEKLLSKAKEISKGGEDTGSIKEVEQLVSNVYKIETTEEISYIGNMGEETTIETIKESLALPSKYEIETTNINGEILTDSQYAGTGSKIKVKNQENEIIKSYTVIVKGDMTGEGEVNLFDIVKLISYIFDKEEGYIWDEALRKAGRVTEEEGVPMLFDIQKLIRHCFDGEKL